MDRVECCGKYYECEYHDSAYCDQCKQNYRLIDYFMHDEWFKNNKGFKYNCLYCGLPLGAKEEFKDLETCPRCNIDLTPEFNPYSS